MGESPRITADSQAATHSAADAMAAGHHALRAADWAAARTHFEAALAAAESPEALEGLGTALFWLDDPATIDVRERAYRRYREGGDPAGAARLAVALAIDHATFRGEEAVAHGWLELASRALEGLDLLPEHGLLAMHQADFALADNDPQEGARLAAQAVDIGRRLGVSDVELLGRAQEGYALVAQGSVTEGMRRLDASAAAAVAGEIADHAYAGYACCYLISACSRVGDLPRAAQWCEQLDAHCRRVGFHALQHLCRTMYAAVLVEQGEWERAEQEMIAARERLGSTRPAMAAEALVRLGELRRRQGRYDEARQLFEQAEPHPLALLGRAATAHDEGDSSAAAADAERYLRAVDVTDRLGRAPGLDLLVHARSALGDRDGARSALTELRAIAHTVGTAPLAATTALAEATLHEAAGDLAAARIAAENAADGFERAGAPFGAARARVLLARVLARTGDPRTAERESRAAALAFDHLGARREAARARQVLQPAERSPLTPRETEVVRLVAAGLSNAQIAERLVLSQHTVHRHVANVLLKLDVPTRAAAAARATSLSLL